MKIHYIGRCGTRKSCLNQEAVEQFNQVLEINPKHEDSLYQKGLILLSLGNFQESYELFVRVLELNPNDLNSNNYKSYCLSKLQESQQPILNFGNQFLIIQQFGFIHKIYFQNSLAYLLDIHKIREQSNDNHSDPQNDQLQCQNNLKYHFFQLLCFYVLFFLKLHYISIRLTKQYIPYVNLSSEFHLFIIEQFIFLESYILLNFKYSKGFLQSPVLQYQQDRFLEDIITNVCHLPVSFIAQKKQVQINLIN